MSAFFNTLSGYASYACTKTGEFASAAYSVTKNVVQQGCTATINSRIVTSFLSKSLVKQAGVVGAVAAVGFGCYFAVSYAQRKFTATTSTTTPDSKTPADVSPTSSSNGPALAAKKTKSKTPSRLVAIISAVATSILTLVLLNR